MPLTEQKNIQLVIGQDYPAPVVDHAPARIAALALYKRAGTSVMPALAFIDFGAPKLYK